MLSLDNELWGRANVQDPPLIKNWLLSQAIACSRVNVTDLCLGYLNAMTWVDGVAVGMESLVQLQENLHYFNNPKLTEEQIANIHKTRPMLTEESLNPALWSKNN